MTAIAWLRRALRVHDNTALAEAAREHSVLIPLYIIDREFFSNADLGYPRVKFWHDSLKELRKDLKDRGSNLIIRVGRPGATIENVIEDTGADALYYNRDYSPYSRRRDREIEEMAEKHDVNVESFKDIVLHEKKEITTNKNEPYRVFSYYRDKWMERDKRKPRSVPPFKTRYMKPGGIPSLESLGFTGDQDVWEGGRTVGKRRLENFRHRINDYHEKRDRPGENGTSKLSPYIKFGNISIREAFHVAEEEKEGGKKGAETWQEELAWRDFYFQLLWNYPETVEEPFQEKYRTLNWHSKKQANRRWDALVNGETGYPFIDAGIRQLNSTGWMHNRARMAVTSFAAKDLWLDWRDLHEYFSRSFVDAELSSMIGGVQWAYSIGADAQPYFRVFNPWTQGEKHDPEGEYIKKHVPELREVPTEHVHRPHEIPEEKQEELGFTPGEDYPEPVVDHQEMREEAIEKFEEARD